MNKQYLKNLQQRAERLLQISSDQENFQYQTQQNKSIWKIMDPSSAKSQPTHNIINELQQYRNTDVQLFKRCIQLTHENSQLKKILTTKQQEKKILKLKLSSLTQKNQFLNCQLNKKTKLQQTQSFAYLNSNNLTHNKQQNQTDDIRRKHEKTLNNKSRSVYRLQTNHIQHKSNKHHIEHKSNKNDRQVNSVNRQRQVQLQNCLKELQTQQTRYEQKISQINKRLQISNRKRQQLQLELSKERQKSLKLWKFIQVEIPNLRDIVTGLNQKVDYRIDKLLLKESEKNLLFKKKPLNK